MLLRVIGRICLIAFCRAFYSNSISSLVHPGSQLLIKCGGGKESVLWNAIELLWNSGVLYIEIFIGKSKLCFSFLYHYSLIYCSNVIVVSFIPEENPKFNKFMDEGHIIVFHEFAIVHSILKHSIAQSNPNPTH